jgi:cinnamoyl-CoA:phenyllactate CoA-transferase
MSNTATQRRLYQLQAHLTSSPTKATVVATTIRKKLLSGIRVVELATVIAAPCACALLCDHGAEVIKVEDPRNPDIARSWGNGDRSDLTADPTLYSAIGGGGSAFTNINRGKKAIALNPTTKRGNEILIQLIGTADIFVTNVRQKSLIKMGLDYDTLRLIYPKLIFGQLSAWGRHGPMKDDPGYDFGAFWAHTGVQEIIRSGDDAPMPRFPGGVGDYTTGHQLFGGIMAALYQREREGIGQLVDAALIRAGLWFLSHSISQGAGGTLWANADDGAGLATGGVRETTELGKRRTSITDAPYKCKDGRWIQLMGLEVKRHLPATLQALNLTLNDISNCDGKIDWRKATSIVDSIFIQKTSQEWGSILTKNNVWWKRINRFDEMLNDEQANASGAFVEIDGLRHKLVGNPIIMSESNHHPSTTAPRFGQHTNDILKSIGVSAYEMNILVKNGTISKGIIHRTTKE